MTELKTATVNVSPTHVTLSYEVTDYLPEHGHWLLSTTFTADPGDTIDQLGFKMVGEQLSAVFTFDHSHAIGQRHYQVAPSRLGSRWTIRFPRDAVRAASGRWTAALDIDGHDAGSVDGEF